MYSAKCYICSVTLDDSNKSFEHIIPNSIGGVSGSFNLLCRNCNTKLGLEIEGDFAKSFNTFCSLLQIKRDRGEIPHITNATDNHGNKYYLEYGRNPIRARPVIEKHQNHYHISARDEKELRHIIKKIKAKEPTLDTDNLEEKFRKTKERFKEQLNLSIGIGGHNFCRTIVKIAVNAYLFWGGDETHVTRAIDYISKGGEELSSIIHWHIEQTDTMLLQPLEVCHCIHIKGDQSSNLLFAYIELFNAPSFVVKLSDSYTGEDFEKTYCLDVIEGQEIKKNVTVRYPEGASPQGYKANDPIFFPVMQSRLNRLNKVIDVRQTQMAFREELNLLWRECKNNYNEDPAHNKIQSETFLQKAQNLLSELVNRYN